MAMDLALKRYLPRLASFFEFLSGPEVLLITGILSPSPLVTPIQELSATNDEIGKLAELKMVPLMSPEWKMNYNSTVRAAFENPEMRRP
jgi:hypothetical protein